MNHDYILPFLTVAQAEDMTSGFCCQYPEFESGLIKAEVRRARRYNGLEYVAPGFVVPSAYERVAA